MFWRKDRLSFRNPLRRLDGLSYCIRMSTVDCGLGHEWAMDEQNELCDNCECAWGVVEIWTCSSPPVTYFPDQPAIQPKNAAAVVGHPLSGVKEQTAGTYAECLAEHGFTTLALMLTIRGKAKVNPDISKIPLGRSRTLRSAVTYLSILDRVDPDRIAARGICASGGYVSNAA